MMIVTIMQLILSPSNVKIRLLHKVQPPIPIIKEYESYYLRNFTRGSSRRGRKTVGTNVAIDAILVNRCTTWEKATKVKPIVRKNLCCADANTNFTKNRVVL